MNDQNIDQSFLSGANATFINDLHKEWKANPNSVPKEWDLWFKNNGDDVILEISLLTSKIENISWYHDTHKIQMPAEPLGDD